MIPMYIPPVPSSPSLSSSKLHGHHHHDHHDHHHNHHQQQQKQQHHHHRHLMDAASSTSGFLAAAIAALMIVYTLTTVVTYTRVAQTEAQVLHANAEAAVAAAAVAVAAGGDLGVVVDGMDKDKSRSMISINVNELPVAPPAGAAITAEAAGVVAPATVEAARKEQQLKANIAALQRTFPIHVANDFEVIMHPAIKIIRDMNKNRPQQQQQGTGAAPPLARQQGPLPIPSDVQETMSVPKFFDDSHGYVYGQATIRDYLGYGKTLMTPEIAATIGSKIPRPNKPEAELVETKGSYRETGELMETIYCSIASYRDPECAGSVEDLYARAKYPERIRVAILDQRLPNSTDPICSQPIQPCEQDPEQAMCKYRHLMDVYEMDARLAVGPVFARHLAHRFYRGEYFAMQIDSHVRFVEHWDEDIVGQWKSAKNEMAVLTTYPSDINNSIDPVTHEGKHWGRPIMCQSDYEGSGETKHLRHGQQPEGLPGITGEPTLHPFWGAGFSFARGHFAIQVPYDQHLPMVFQGEEISIGLRGFTYGYDYYSPERSVLFHMYAVKENEEKRKSVPLFWENARMYQGTGVRAMKRLNSIIGMAGPYDPSEYEQDDLVKYGLGQVRTTEKFFKVYGIHVKEQKVEHHLCRFVGINMMRLFKPAMRSDRMGLDFDKINYEFVDPAPDDPQPR